MPVPDAGDELLPTATSVVGSSSVSPHDKMTPAEMRQKIQQVQQSISSTVYPNTTSANQWFRATPLRGSFLFHGRQFEMPDFAVEGWRRLATHHMSERQMILRHHGLTDKDVTYMRSSIPEFVRPYQLATSTGAGMALDNLDPVVIEHIAREALDLPDPSIRRIRLLVPHNSDDSFMFMIYPVGGDPSKEEDTMLEQLLKLYTMYMGTGVTSPMPHFVGPPGAGKSTVVQQLADFVGVKLHTINVSRISPLELEGVQMPNKDGDQLTMLTATFWTRMKDGDILLLDEFLRGFPEVYNGLLDILTARQVGDHKLPKVFIIGASNTVATYDGALEDRLLHLPVPDPRTRKNERRRLAQLLVDSVGLLPEMVNSPEMARLFDEEVLPTYGMLDSYKGKGTVATTTNLNGSSLRKLIGQALLRQVESKYLAELIDTSNSQAIRAKKFRYVVLMSGKGVADTTVTGMRGILDSPKLSAKQRTNLELNLQLVEMELAKNDNQREDTEDDDDIFTAPDPF